MWETEFFCNYVFCLTDSLQRSLSPQEHTHPCPSPSWCRAAGAAFGNLCTPSDELSFQPKTRHPGSTCQRGLAHGWGVPCRHFSLGFQNSFETAKLGEQLQIFCLHSFLLSS